MSRRWEWISGILFLALFLAAAAAQQPGPAAGQPVQERLGHPANSRLLIIHSDDLGMSHSVNRATFEALEKGWITSSSILVPCPWFPEVAQWARAHPDLDVGVHLALDSEWNNFRWGPIAGREKVSSLLDSEGYLPRDPSLLHAKIPEVESELHAQVDKARAAGIHLSHLDSHMVALMSTPELFEVYQRVGRDYGLPILLTRSGAHGFPAAAGVPDNLILLEEVLSIDPGVPEREWMDWYKKALTPLKPGVYELIVHLAHDDEEMQGATQDHPDWGAAWRQSDFDTMRSPEFRRFLKDQGFILISWRDLAKALPPGYQKETGYIRSGGR